MLTEDLGSEGADAEGGLGGPGMRCGEYMLSLVMPGYGKEDSPHDGDGFGFLVVQLTRKAAQQRGWYLWGENVDME